MRIAILSPHRDDAAFSCGLAMHALLRAGTELTVVNVFTRSNYAIDLSTVDPALPPVDAISHARYAEDQRFVADLIAATDREPEAVRLHDLDWLDAPLRLTVPTEQVLALLLTPDEVLHEAGRLAEPLRFVQTFDMVFAPLALGGHIDHRVTREFAVRCISTGRLVLYEDLPYAARLSPAERKNQTRAAVPSNIRAVYRSYALHLPHGPHLKKRFAMHYPSQIAESVADEMAAYAASWNSMDTGVERWWSAPDAGTLIAGLLRDAAVPCSLVEEQQ